MLAFHGNQWPLNFERFGFYAPKHYLTQFHPKYNKAITDYKTFNEKADDYNTERPAMTSWRITSWKAGDRFLLATRNPYYWKVDPQGNQLPYIDELRVDLVENDEALNLKAINGEIDFQFRQHPDLEVLAASGEQGKERLPRLPVARRERLADRLFRQPVDRRSGPAPGLPEPEVPPGAVVRHQPQADQRGQFLRTGQGAQRDPDPGVAVLHARDRDAVRPVRPGQGERRCSTRSA